MTAQIYLVGLIGFFLAYFAVVQRLFYRPANAWMKWLRRIALFALPLIYFLARGYFAVMWWFMGGTNAIFYYEGATLLLVIIGSIVVAQKVNWPESRFSRWPTRAYGILLAVLATGLGALTYWMEHNATADVALLEKQFSTLIQASARDVAPKDNALPLYFQLDNAYRSDQVNDDPMNLLDQGVHSPEFQAAIAGRQSQVDMARQAAKLPDCVVVNPPIDSIGMLNQTGLGVCRQASNLLYASARWKAANGDVDGAIDDLLLIYPTAQQEIRAYPGLIGYLVGIGINAQGDAARIHILPSVTSAAQLDRMDIARRDLKPALLRALEIECASLKAITGHIIAPQMVAMGPAGAGTNLTVMVQSSGPVSFARTFGLFIWRREAVRKNSDYFDANFKALLESIELGPFQATPELRALDVQNKKLFIKLRAILMPSIKSAVQTMYTDSNNQDCVQIAIAATRYRLEHGEYPASAELLTPKYLPVWPTDIFDGKPIRMKKQDDGSLIIWSVGKDQKDDGGKVDPGNGSYEYRIRDVGYILQMPEISPM